MKVLSHRIAGDPVTVYFPTREEDLAGFWAWLDRPRKALCVDTETTGLDTYARSFGIRLVQFGDHREAWVLQVGRFTAAIVEAFRRLHAAKRYLVFHNATFDLLALDRFGLTTLEAAHPLTFDTSVLAHLLDPREPKEGGIGRKLKVLSAQFIDPEAPDTQEGLTAVFNSLGYTKETGWALIDIDHPTYVLYAGLDVILGARLFGYLAPQVKARGLGRLARFEMALAGLLARMERRGVLLDVPYTIDLTRGLRQEALKWQEVAARYGVDNVNSTDQVSAALLGMGETLTEKTKGGAFKVDKEVLLPLADLDKDLERLGARDPNPLAEAVVHAKRSDKWAKSYAEAMLDRRDDADRVHPKINGLQARTARMSISRPPLQQLPSGDWTIRRCLLPDPGMEMVAVDYRQVEMKVLAALSEDKAMLAAIASGLDIHDAVATLMYGEGFSKGQRKLAKNTGFGKVFGGGIETLARQSGVSHEVAAQARSMFDRQFPGIKRYSRRLIARAENGNREVVTPSGRILPLDRHRIYAATNYMVQSTARDVLAQALLDIDEAGLGDHLLLPVHDEVIAQAPIGEGRDLVAALQEAMTMDFYGVTLDTDGEVYGPSWGHGYGAPE